MPKDYYFSFEEPILTDKEIVCAFYISNIERKRSFFFIVNENNKLILYYSMISGSDIIKQAKEYVSKNKLEKETTIKDILETSDFKKEYINKNLQRKILDNQNYIKNTIDKMTKGNIQNAKNNIQGLDGFSVELKLNKEDKPYYAWCTADDTKYFYVLDFINSILDELDINKEYRFKKYTNNLLN